MRFVTISDVHIKEPGDTAEELFLSFLKSPEVNNSEGIYLLGDIFDLVVGGHLDYRYKFKRVFDALVEHANAGKMIYQFEGNHDFHFQNIIKVINKEELDHSRWFYINRPFVLENMGKRILLAHGDELELDNLSYKIYRLFIRSRLIYNLANLYYDFNFVESIGKYLSKKSRKRNTKNYGQSFNQDKIKGKFRKSAVSALEKFNCEFYICGHSHCKDEWLKEDFSYYNNGYFPREKSFIYYNGDTFEFVEIKA